MKNKIKLQRLREIVLYHLKEHEETEKGKTTLGQIDNLEEDLKVWFKNFLLTCEELDVKADVTFIGEDGEYEEGGKDK